MKLPPVPPNTRRRSSSGRTRPDSGTLKKATTRPSRTRLGRHCLLVLACLASTVNACEDLLIKNGWVRQPPPRMDVTAAYFVLENPGTEAIDITGVTSDAFAQAMFHQTSVMDGRSRMQHLAQIRVNAGSQFVAAPGAFHLMLTGLRGSYQQGEEIEMRLECGRGPALLARLPVRPTEPDERR